jgi:hypothetical protein
VRGHGDLISYPHDSYTFILLRLKEEIVNSDGMQHAIWRSMFDPGGVLYCHRLSCFKLIHSKLVK